jgi:hypothetical protein
MFRPALIVALVVAVQARAEGPVSPQAFEAMSVGRTLHFTLEGKPFGAEQYVPGRRSLWRFADGTCEAGSWRAEGERICFTYERDPEPQCWRMVEVGGRLRAALAGAGDGAGLVLDLCHADDAPLPCPGPDLGT